MIRPPMLPPSALIKGFRHNGVIYRDVFRSNSLADCETMFRHGRDVYRVGEYLLTGEIKSIKFFARQLGTKPVKLEN